MAIQKTESRLPQSFTHSDLGQSVANGTGKVILISYLSSPIVYDRIQNYVVFVTDPAIAVDKYRWTITINDFDFKDSTKTTTEGVLEFRPKFEGFLKMKLELLDAGNAVLETVNMEQLIISPNAFVEQAIENPSTSAPLAADPDATREVMNDLKGYIDQLIPAAQTTYMRALSSIAYTGTLALSKVKRNKKINEFAKLLNGGKYTDLFDASSKKGIGVCAVRPQILAMFLKNGAKTYIPFNQLENDPKLDVTIQKTIKTDFNALAENDVIDLFNLLRFPKSNIKMTKSIVEELGNKFFAGTVLNTLFKDKTKSRELFTHFEGGPFKV